MSLKQILAEEAELEKELYGQKKSDHSGDESENTIIPNVDTFEADSLKDEDGLEKKEDPTEKSDEDAQDSKKDPSESDEKQKSSWKQRFTNYKAATDKTISTLRKDNSFLLSKLGTTEAKVYELEESIRRITSNKKDLFAEVITQEDIDTIGPEAVEIIKKANKKATEAALQPMQEELNRLKAKELADYKAAAENRRREAYGRFTQNLGKLVPDFEAINLDPNFEKYMLELDPQTGEKRLDAFRSAEDYLDADRVADFFIDFKASAPKSKREMLEEKMTPDSTSSSQPLTSPKKQTFSISEVNKFFDDVTKGAYRHKTKEADEIEARITRAYIEGRITK